MQSLTWGQVNLWRLSQHGLAQRSPRRELVEAVSRTMGVHAQVMSAAEMAIAARVNDLSSQDIQAALWHDRSLVKTWMMRLTSHLIPTVEFPIYIAARRITDINWPSLFGKEGIDRATLDAYLAAAPEILARGPLTRRQFIEAISANIKSSEFRDFLMKGSWGMAFKPLALHGDLCYGPNDGQDTTFIHPRAWIGDWQDLDPETSLQAILRHYLQVYGPARPRNFQVWWWMSGIAAKNAFNAITGETEQVEVDGWRAIALKSTIQSMRDLEPSGEVHLLPAFDVYTVGLARGKDLERLLALENQKKVYRQQGWVSAVVLVDGFIKGTWEYKLQRSTTTLSVTLFSPLINGSYEKLAVEADRLGKFLNSKIELEISPPA
jgi:hypothetical protein